MADPLRVLKETIDLFGYKISSGQKQMQPKGSKRSITGGWVLAIGLISLFINPLVGMLLIIAGYIISTK